MTVHSVATEHYEARAAIVTAATKAALARWETVVPTRVGASWNAVLPEVMTIVAGAQLAAARAADTYVDSALDSQNMRADADGRVVAGLLAGIASDGRTLDGLLRSPAVATIQALNGGATVSRAMATGQATLDMIVGTQVADAGRVADGIAITARPRVGYVRMLTPPSCSRCAILAGRWYRYDAGFDRHPRCNCTQIPASEDTAGDLRTDPQAYFDSLSKEEQDRIFTKAGARAIRDGADMGQVVNARRGMTTAGRDEFGNRIGRLAPTRVFGRDVFTTTEGTTTRGLAGQRLIDEGARLSGETAETVLRRSRAGDVTRTVTRQRVQVPRLMPESIYQLAESRADAVRLLRRFGYIT